MNNTQIPAIIYLKAMTILKKTLDLASYKFGKKSDEYKYYREQIFDIFYNELKKLFKQMEKAKLIVKCECDANIRKGYTSCKKCRGCGYRNAQK